MNAPISFSAPVLAGRYVRLEPLADTHREPLRAAGDDERIWAFTLSNARGSGFDEWFDAALAERASGIRLPYAVRMHFDGAVVGSTSYLDPSVRDKRVEIGSTWYRPDVWATAVNPECKLLLLAHAFETLGLNRVSFVTDLLNVRSQAAIAKLGAVREGVLRGHKITQGGRVRDSVIFSIIASEWPAVRERLTRRIETASGAG